MPSLPVVKHFHVIEQADPRIVARLVVTVHDQFGLERMEEALHRRIVPTITLAAHALPDAIAVDDFPVASGGVRGPLVECSVIGGPRCAIAMCNASIASLVS